ncbi:MAG: hypothetical protein GX638_06360 [Crenarchaeota archaeon]|nr:hypothetical protein [Thermoproteota archaeon]
MRVERKSFGKRILDSFVGLLIGFLLFIGSFVVLFINEGHENLDNYARVASEYNQENTYDEGDLVYIVDSLSATSYAADNYLKDSDYIYVKRVVEMYAYVENEHTETKENLGGSSTTTYTYSYETKWTQNPQKTSTFQGDNNELPQDIPSNYDVWINNMPNSNSDVATGITIDGIDVASGLDFSGANGLAITASDVKNLAGNESVSGNYIYRANNGSSSNTKVGDIRISFIVIKASDKGLLLARYNNNKFEPFHTKKNSEIFRFFAGVESQNQAVQILNTEYKTTLWIMRLLGFLMMFIGLLLIANPVMTLLSVVPIFAKIGRFTYGIIAFVISLVLSAITILIAMIFNNIYLAIGVVVLLIVIVVLVLRSKKKKKDSTKAKKATA